MTPCLNAAETLDRTILSVLTQAGDLRVRHHVQDGGSTDGTVERLGWWRDLLASGGFPLVCDGATFDFASGPDEGMYDAVSRGVARLDPAPNEFVTWINADDVLAPGALALVAAVARRFSPEAVSWLGGATTVLRDDVVVVSYDRPVPTAALRSGICDGTHWDFLQQEGTFFRRRLWDAADAADAIRPMRLAGDWNLWRLFAREATLVQFDQPLGAFRIHDGQMSARLGEAYEREMDAVLSPAARREAMRGLVEMDDVPRTVLRSSISGELRLETESCRPLLQWRYGALSGS